MCADNLPSRTLRILHGEYAFRIETNDPLRDDFRRHGERWIAFYRSKMAEVETILQQRGEAL